MYICFCMDICFHLYQVNTQEQNAWIIRQEYDQLSKRLPDGVPKCLRSSQECVCSGSLHMLVDTWDDTPSSECVVIPCNFHFPRLILRTVQLQILYQINAFQMFSPSLWLSSHLLPCVQKSRYFQFWGSPVYLSTCFFMVSVSGDVILPSSRQLLMPEIRPSKCQLSISFLTL